MVEFQLTALLSQARERLAIPWFTFGETPIHAGRLLGLVLIIGAVWGFASRLEQGVRRVALRGDGHSKSAAAVYTWARVLRYEV